ncbi:hypothetical protein M2273_004096 [Mucilaginibacter lappiensis]
MLNALNLQGIAARLIPIIKLQLILLRSMIDYSIVVFYVLPST